MSERDLLDKIESRTGKDMGDFGGWHGLKEYCVKYYYDDLEVCELVNKMEEKPNE